MAIKLIQKEREKDFKLKTEMADAHSHLDMIDPELIKEAISYGVLTIITNGVNTKTNIKTLEICDNVHVFAAIGIDPENAMLVGDRFFDTEMNFNINLIKSNTTKIVSIGEIGLDYKKATDERLKDKQRRVFRRFLELATELDMPVSVHSRESMDEVLTILKENKMKKVHLHYFEGNLQQAKEAERHGYMISLPPIDSPKRREIVKFISIDHLMVESDSPVVGATPKDVEKPIRMIADVKGLTFEKAAEQLTLNTKKFFNISAKKSIMRH